MNDAAREVGDAWGIGVLGSLAAIDYPTRSDLEALPESTRDMASDSTGRAFAATEELPVEKRPPQLQRFHAPSQERSGSPWQPLRSRQTWADWRCWLWFRIDSRIWREVLTPDSLEHTSQEVSEVPNIRRDRSMCAG